MIPSELTIGGFTYRAAPMGNKGVCISLPSDEPQPCPICKGSRLHPGPYSCVACRGTGLA